MPFAASPESGSPNISSPLTQPTVLSAKFSMSNCMASGSIFCRASLNTTISPRAAAMASFRPEALPRASGLRMLRTREFCLYFDKISFVPSFDPSETTTTSTRSSG